MLLSVYERAVKDQARKMFMCLAAGRQEYILFVPEGLSTAEPVTERLDVVNELTLLKIDPMKLPDLFKNKYLYRMATELLEGNLSETEKLELQEKVEEAVASGAFEPVDPMELAAAGKAGSPVNSKSLGSDSSPSADQADPPKLDKDGNQMAPEGIHLIAKQSTSGIGDMVYKQLSEDYDTDLLSWVQAAQWQGPLQIPLSSIDDSNREAWEAAGRTAKIADMGEKMKDGWDKPIILVNEPNDSQLRLIDGHTRYLSAESIGKDTINAFVATVGMVGGDWEKMHDLQREGEDGGMRSNQLKSNQK